MTTIWNQHLLSHFADGSLNLTSHNIGLMLMYSYVTPTATSPDDATQLATAPGFQELSGSGYTRVVVQGSQTTTNNVTSVVIGSDYALTLNKQAYVAAGIWYVTGSIAGFMNPWIFISDDMFGNVVTPGATVGTSATPKVLFSYQPRGTTVDIALGAIVQSPGPTYWESSRIQHVYLYPQRVNFIPNPSFEDVGMFGWRSDQTLTRVVGGVDSAANYYGHTPGKVVESISIQPQGPMRFSAYVRNPTASPGSDQVTLKLICLDDTYTQQAVIVGKTRPVYQTWLRVDDILVPGDLTVAVIPRIEAANGPLDFDLVLLEQGEALHDYFDGDSNTGMAGDFTWQGQEAQSYSCYYTNRNNTAARLFGAYLYPQGQVTLPCLVQDWVPTGTQIYTHWDVLSTEDTRNVLKDWNPKTFTP